MHAYSWAATSLPHSSPTTIKHTQNGCRLKWLVQSILNIFERRFNRRQTWEAHAPPSSPRERIKTHNAWMACFPHQVFISCLDDFGMYDSYHVFSLCSDGLYIMVLRSTLRHKLHAHSVKIPAIHLSIKPNIPWKTRPQPEPRVVVSAFASR